MDVDDLLSEYGMERGLAQDYIEHTLFLNQTKTAEAMDVSRQTVQRYKNIFGEMSRGERIYLLAQLGEESLMELVHEVATETE